MISKWIAWDQELFLLLNNLGTPNWDYFWLFMTNKLYQIPLYLVLLFLIYKTFGFKKTCFTLLSVALMIALSDQLSNLFKNVLFLRPRPCRAEGIANFTRFIVTRCGRHGFFSAHASSSMALAFFVGKMLHDRYRFIFDFMIIWALLVGYSRIYVGVHYPADVLVGMGIGAILGYLAYRGNTFLNIKYGN